MNYKDPYVIELRKKNHQFDRLCTKHEKLEADIENLTKGVGNSAVEELKITEFKKEKLAIKEQLSLMMNES